jgi:phosphate transport system permease protein
MKPVRAFGAAGEGTVTTSAPSTRRANSSASWRLSDRLGLAFAWFLGLLFCAICASIVIFLLIQGIHYVRPGMLVSNPQVGFNENETGGFLAPMIGTFLVAGIAIGIAGPVGVAIAVWLSEFARPAWLARIVESTVEMFAGAPTVVLALFGIILFQAPALGFLSADYNGVVYGKSFFAAGAMLSLVALPLVVTTVREGLQAIPNHVREASYAVGKTKIATTRRVLLPAVRPSVITGSMLGVGRVIGDTAVIVLLLSAGTEALQGVGHVPLLSALRGTGSTLTSYIFDNAPTGEFNQQGKAYAAAFVLIVVVLALNAIVDVFGRRSKELRWS